MTQRGLNIWLKKAYPKSKISFPNTSAKTSPGVKAS